MTQAMETESVYSTPWFSLVGKKRVGEQEPHYAIETDDYVAILALTQNEQVVLVRQFRHAVETRTVELPAGHVDAGESPEEAARRELLEETGYRAGAMELLGHLKPDTGRLANRLWAYFARDVESPASPVCSEEGIEVFTCSLDAFVGRIASGEFDHALHLAVLFLALQQEKLALR